MADVLFDTWEGDDSTFEGDLSRVLTKHGVSVEGLSAEQLRVVISSTLRALEDAGGNSSQFTTSMFMLYKELEIGKQGQPTRYHYGPNKQRTI